MKTVAVVDTPRKLEPGTYLVHLRETVTKEDEELVVMVFEVVEKLPELPKIIDQHPKGGDN